MNAVEVIVTKKQVGTGPVVLYSHRQGLQYYGGPDNATPRVRPCDSGLHEPRVCTPGWMPHYSPHSFHGEFARYPQAILR